MSEPNNAAPAPDAVRRFDCFGKEDGVYESATGAHVAYADYAAQGREIAAIRAQLADAQRQRDALQSDAAWCESEREMRKRAEADNAALRARLEIPAAPFEAHDGIACREETIAQQDKTIAALLAVVEAADAMRDANKRFPASASYRDVVNAAIEYGAARAKLEKRK